MAKQKLKNIEPKSTGNFTYRSDFTAVDSKVILIRAHGISQRNVYNNSYVTTLTEISKIPPVPRQHSKLSSVS